VLNAKPERKDAVITKIINDIFFILFECLSFMMSLFTLTHNESVLRRQDIVFLHACIKIDFCFLVEDKILSVISAIVHTCRKVS